jgi:hypothetical protein
VALHGDQEGRFFHGYYDHYCYLPLYVFAGEHVLGVRLRPANIDASAGSLPEIRRIVEQIRQRWPAVRITLRGDSGFCRDELMSWCEQQGVDYVFGFARNERLRRLFDEALTEAARQWEQTKKPARVFCRISISDDHRLVESCAARRGESRAHRRQRESTVCSNFPGS